MEDALEMRLLVQDELRKRRADPDLVVVELHYETESSKATPANPKELN